VVILRIVVISDSHGNTAAISKALTAQKEATHVFFLGDCTKDAETVAENFPEKTFHIVSGNCDYHSFFPSTAMENINGTLVFYSHGHPYFVKQSHVPFLQVAQSRGAKIALFGHTHTPLIKYENGVHLVNPGSISLSRDGAPSYAVIDVEENGIMPILIRI
jgi:putative phosphoesterase